jgi:hypothetical protein
MKREKGNNEIDKQTEARTEKEMEELKISNYILTPTNPTEQKKNLNYCSPKNTFEREVEKTNQKCAENFSDNE